MMLPQMTARPAAGYVLARPSTSLAPRIVILGSGFAGVTTALELAKRYAGVLPVHITLLSERNFFLFTPMLAEAAAGAVETRHVLYPIRPLCGAWGIGFGEMSVEAIDLDRRRVIACHRRSLVRQKVHYDKLVLALGATPNVTMVPGVAGYALTFKGAGGGPDPEPGDRPLRGGRPDRRPVGVPTPPHVCRGGGRARGDGADRRPGGADTGDSPPTLPLDPPAERPPRPGWQRDPSPDRDEPGIVYPGAAPQTGDRTSAPSHKFVDSL